MNNKIKAGIAAVVAGTLLTAGGVALAEGSGAPNNPAAGVTGQAAPRAGKAGKAGKGLGNPMKNVVRGDMTVMGPDGKAIAIHVERGTVGDIADGSFSVTGADGQKTTVKTDASTAVKPKATQLADLNGKVATVVSDHKDGDSWVAKFVASGEKRKGAQGQGQPGAPAPQADAPTN